MNEITTDSASIPLGRRFDSLELWCVDLVSAGPALRQAEHETPRLSVWERQKALDFADAAGAAQWLATHVALRILIERAVGVRWRGVSFERERGSKPQLKGAPVAFSLSHVPGWALIGLTSSEYIGVDLECMRPVRVRGPRRAQIERAAALLSPDQRLPVEADARFLQSWVRLEALAKADGRGIGHLLTRLAIIGSENCEAEELSARIGALRATLPPAVLRDLAMSEGLFAAAALPGEMPPTEVFALPHSVDGLNRLVA